MLASEEEVARWLEEYEAETRARKIAEDARRLEINAAALAKLNAAALAKRNRAKEQV